MGADTEEGRSTPQHKASDAGERLITVADLRPKDYNGTCLRPLGLCELGGSCDACWYSPDHPRHKERRNS